MQLADVIQVIVKQMESRRPPGAHLTGCGLITC